jgi:Stage II sporulation protein E (SpoIIE)
MRHFLAFNKSPGSSQEVSQVRRLKTRTAGSNRHPNRYHAEIMIRRILQGKSLFAIVLVVFALGLVARAATPPAPLNIEALGKSTVALDGDWQFHLGDDPAWASPGLDDSGWERIKVDKPWGDQTHFGYTGYGWYRRHLNFVPLTGVDSDLALLLPRIDDAYEVYWNGNLIGHLGKLPPHPVWYSNLPRQIFGLGRPTEGVLAFRVWKAPYLSSDTGEAGGLNGPPMVGSSQAIAAYKGSLDYRWLHSQLSFFGVDLFYCLILVLGLVAWLQNRNQKVLLWLSLWACALLLSVLLNGLRLPWTYGVSTAIAQSVLALADGLLEARNPAGDLFSFERLRALIATQPDAKQATDAAVAFGQDDDITVLTLTRLAPGVESTTSLLAPDLVSSSA